MEHTTSTHNQARVSDFANTGGATHGVELAPPRVISHAHSKTPSRDERSKTRGTANDVMMASQPALPVNRQARASPAFRDGGNVPHDVYNTNCRGWDGALQPSSNGWPASEWLVRDNKGKV